MHLSTSDESTDAQDESTDAQDESMDAQDADSLTNPESLDTESRPNADELVQRTRHLLGEIGTFKAHLKTKRKLNRVEYRHFEKDVKKDLKYLENLCETKRYDEASRHAIKSSNLPFMQAVWDAAKGARDIVRLKRHSTTIDVVAEGGAEWIKVSNLTERRLLLDMAKEGWEWDENSEEEEDEDEDDDDDDYSNDDNGYDGEGFGDGKDSMRPRSKAERDGITLPLLKIVDDLLKQAKATRIRYKHPRVKLLLPKISTGSVREVDSVIDRISKLGVIVICANDLPSPSPVEDVLDEMVVDEFADFTDTLNIDCTILLAMVSDISHSQVVELPWFNSAIRRQIEMEAKEQLLPLTLWPAMRGRELVCTKEAANRMRELVDTIGTETERARTRLFMGDDKSKSQNELIQDFQSLSEHQVPPDWQLPISVVEYHKSCLEKLPPVAAMVESRLTDINKSIFLYGWSAGTTTISSNKTAAKLIDSIIEESGTSQDEEGPHIWICPTSRSLVAKEKERKT